MPAKAAPSSDEYPEVHGAWDQVEAKEQIRAEVDEEDLDDERRAAKDEHVEPGEQAQRQEPRHAHEREDQSEDDPESCASDRDVDRPPERENEHMVRVEDPLPQDSASRERRGASPYFSFATAPASFHLVRIVFIVPSA